MEININKEVEVGWKEDDVDGTSWAHFSSISVRIYEGVTQEKRGVYPEVKLVMGYIKIFNRHEIYGVNTIFYLCQAKTKYQKSMNINGCYVNRNLT